MRYTPILFLLALTGCPQTDTGKDDTAGGPDETGDTDPNYESGCITIDGGGGYAKIADAVTLANEGAVIELCAGAYEEAVTVDKGVTIRGDAAGGTQITGPGSDVPFTITGAGVTLENLTVSSPRTAIVLDGATGVTLAGINIASSGSWGITATDATATIDGLTIVQPAAGGVQVSGGQLTVANASIEYPASFGFDISDDAVVSLTNTTIQGPLMLTDNVSDGYGAQVIGAELSMTDSSIASADGMGIYTEESTITLTNTTISDSVYLGVFGFDSTYDFDGVTMSGNFLQGAYLDGPSVSLTNTAVTTPTGNSCSLTYEEWGTEGNPWCGALNISGDTVALSGITVSGYENYGVIVQPNTENGVAALTWDGGTVTDNGRWGAQIVYAEGTISNVAFTANREPEIASPCQGYVNQSVGLLAGYSDLSLDGITFQGNAGWGYTALYGSTDITNTTFDGNACTAFVNYQNVGTVTASTFTNGTDSGGIFDREGVLVVDGNTFVDNKSGADVLYDYGDGTFGRSVYSGGQGQDIVAYLTGSITVSNNTFTGGDSSITAQQVSEAIVTGNTWTDYEGSIAYFYEMPQSSPAIFADNAADDVVGPVVQSSYGPVEVSNVTVGTTRVSDLVTYEYYDNDVLQYSYSYQSSNSVFYTSGYYYDDGAGTITDQPGAIALEDVTVASAYSTLVYSYDAEIDVNGLEAGDVGGSAVSGSWQNYSPDVELSDIVVGRTSSTAFSFSNSSTEFGAVTLSNVSVEGSDSGGIYASALGAVELTDVSLGDVSGAGVQTSSRSYDYTYYYDSASGSYIYTYVDLDAATELSATNLTIASSGSYGLGMSGGSATLDGATLSSASGDGITLDGVTAFTANGVTIASPAGTGVYVVDNYTAYSYESSAYETIDADTVSTLTDVTVSEAGGSAFVFDGGSVTLTSCDGVTSGGNGLDLSATTADVQGNSFTGNGVYGMACADTTLTACAANDLSGNTTGTHSGCEDSCGE